MSDQPGTDPVRIVDVREEAPAHGDAQVRDATVLPARERLPMASLLDTARAVGRVLLPLLARGLIVRRPPLVAVAERIDLDRRAVREMQRLRQRYGSGPLLLQVPLRRIALVLDPGHVHRVLQASPEVFSAANLEKQHALSHFQPEGVLVSEGHERADRRRFNEAVLDTHAPVHRQGDAMLSTVREEAAAIRALALLDAHPEYLQRVREELAGLDLSRPHELPLLRAAVLESLRLWPTTPGILRDTKVATAWRRGTLPRGSAVMIFAPFFHRDDRRLPQADRFAPELWSHPRTTDDWPLVPFSEGPVVCPGQNLVLLLTTAMIASLLERHDLRLRSPGRLDRGQPLPSMLNPFDLVFDVRPMGGV